MFFFDTSNETVVLIGTFVVHPTTVWKWSSPDGRLKDLNPAYSSCTMLRAVPLCVSRACRGSLHVCVCCTIELPDDTSLLVSVGAIACR